MRDKSRRERERERGTKREREREREKPSERRSQLAWQIWRENHRLNLHSPENDIVGARNNENYKNESEKKIEGKR